MAGVGPLKIVEGNFDTKKYINTLETHFLPYLDENPDLMLQEDNAPCHKSWTSEAFKIEKGIRTLDWVPYSPDLNPIENLFSILKRKVAQRLPGNKSELIESIKEVWKNEIFNQYCKNLVLSMQNRIRSVIEANGGHTKY